MLDLIEARESRKGAKLIGKRARPCSRCGGATHWVNIAGGAECAACVPPPAGYSGLRLSIARGIWEDADDPFAASRVPAAATPAASPATPATTAAHVGGVITSATPQLLPPNDSLFDSGEPRGVRGPGGIATVTGWVIDRRGRRWWVVQGSVFVFGPDELVNVFSWTWDEVWGGR